MKKNYLLVLLLALSGLPIAQAQTSLQDNEKVNLQANEKIEQESKSSNEDDDVLFVQETKEEEKPIKVYDNFSIAIQTKNYSKIDIYLKQGSNINHNLYSGNTIVQLSAFHRDLELLWFAAERNANLSNLNENDQSILYWGAAGKSVQYLEEARALLGKNFNSLMAQKTKRGQTPLHAAVVYAGNLEVINWLISNKVDLAAKDENGKTALHYAASMRKWDVLELLLKRGGNINDLDNEGISVETYLFEKMDVLTVEIFYPYVSPQKKKFIEESVGKIFPEKLLKMIPQYKLTPLQIDKIKSSKEDFIYGKEVIK